MKTMRFVVSISAEDNEPESLARAGLLRVLRDAAPGHDIQAELPRTDFTDVRAFHAKFGVPESDQPAFLDNEAFLFRLKFLQEELDEFEDDFCDNDLLGAADALVDLVYVAMGTAAMMGLPWELLWAEVQRANMSKVRATDASQSKRSSTLDVVKPEGWAPPNHAPALGAGPWPTFNTKAGQ